MQQTYDDIEAGGYSLAVVEAVLEAWALSHTTRQWPAWASLKSALDVERASRQPLALEGPSQLRRPLPPPDPWLAYRRGETLAEHVERTCGKGSPGWGDGPMSGLRQATYDLGMSMVRRRQEGGA